MNYQIFIPVRLNSSRLPNKPLIDICGKTVIQRAIEQCPQRPVLVCPKADAAALMRGIDRSVGFDLILTEEEDERRCHCGTDRIAIAVQRFPNLMEGIDIAINFQGDNILASEGAFSRLVELMCSSSNNDNKIGTLFINSFSVGHVCAIRGIDSRLVYFSRTWSGGVAGCRHVGIYAYSKAALKKFHSLTETLLEQQEKLEQLRWISYGLPIYGAKAGRTLGGTAPHFGWIDINTMDDVMEARKLLCNELENQI